MRFETRFDGWLAALLILTGIVTSVVLPASRLLAPGAHPVAPLLTFSPFVIFAVVLSCTLPQYYELRNGGLFIRQGWRKSLIPYASLIEVQPTSDTRSAPVFATHRILLVTEEGQRFVIAVAEDERFLAELSKRCP